MIGKTVAVIVDRPLGSYHPKHLSFTKEEILKQVHFQEQYFKITVVM